MAKPYRRKLTCPYGLQYQEETKLGAMRMVKAVPVDNSKASALSSSLFTSMCFADFSRVPNLVQ